MSSRVWPNGFGAVAGGDELAAAKPIHTSANVYFVNFSTGNDARSGLDRQNPKKTLVSAMSACSANDIIVLMSGHAETIGDLQWQDGVRVIGEGTAGGLPTVVLTPSAATIAFMMLLGISCELRNVTVASCSGAMSKPKIIIDQAGVRMYGVRFLCGSNDTGGAIRFDDNCAGDTGDYAYFESCSFISTATASPSTALTAVGTSSSVGPRGVTFSNCVFDDGTYGFSSGYALLDAGAKMTRLNIIGASLLNGATLYVRTATKFVIHPELSTGGGSVIED